MNNKITKQELLEKYPKMFKDGNTTMGWGLEVPISWLPIINELCDSLQNRGWLGSGCPHTRPQVVVDQVKTKFGQLRFYFHLKNTDDEWEKTSTEEERIQFYRNYYQYCQGMIDFADNILYNMENENGKRKDS
jgi:hypothetical protein